MIQAVILGPGQLISMKKDGTVADANLEKKFTYSVVMVQLLHLLKHLRPVSTSMATTQFSGNSFNSKIKATNLVNIPQ